MTKEFGYSNPMQVPKLEKIVINMGVGDATADLKKLDAAVEELTAHQRPAPGEDIGEKGDRRVQDPQGSAHRLQGDAAQGADVPVLDRLITIALPRVRDFRGIVGKGFDGRGNFAMGLKEQIIFPEINYDRVDDRCVGWTFSSSPRRRRTRKQRRC